MAIPFPIGKRSPELGDVPSNYSRYAKLSKADWADAFVDLYRQLCGDELAAAEFAIMDAERRTEILSRYRRQERS